MPDSAQPPRAGATDPTGSELTEADLEVVIELAFREMALDRLRAQVEARLRGPLRRIEDRLRRLERSAREAARHA